MAVHNLNKLLKDIPMSKIIHPTIGRRVWYWPNKAATSLSFTINDDSVPMDAGIVFVWGDRCVNLDVTDHAGKHHAFTSVRLVQPGDDKLENGGYAEWMPYQIGQAIQQSTDEKHGEGTKVFDPAAEIQKVESYIGSVLGAAAASTKDPLAGALAKAASPVTEADIKAAGADVAPRITPTDIEAEIASEHYFTAADGETGARYNAAPRLSMQVDTSPAALRLLTFCVLVLRNGFTVVGTSACASPENFKAEIGRRVAREDAVRQVWPLLGFRLRDQLAAQP